MDDLKEMLDTFPTLVLTSKSPVIWEGILMIFENNTHGIEDRIGLRVKLILPSYPTLDEAVLHFGRNVAVLYGKNFENQVQELLTTSESVISFFSELKSVIEKQLEKFFINDFMYKSFDAESINKLLRELDVALSENSDIEIGSTKDLCAIKLMLYDVSMTVRPIKLATGEHSWKIITSDLPEMLGLSLPDKRSVSLKEVKNFFQKQMDILEEFWNQLRKLDQYCWVTDPINPKPYHLYRRIVLSKYLSILVTLNPLDPMNLPSIRFLGSSTEVEEYEENFSEIILNWDSEISVYDNLLTLLNIEEFPRPPRLEETDKNEGIVGENECCICFSLELENGETPAVICNNHSCRKCFHSSCLFMWLQESASNKIVFNQIHGTCPNCTHEICCLVPVT